MAQAALIRAGHKVAYWIKCFISAFILHPDGLDNPCRDYLKGRIVVALIAVILDCFGGGGGFIHVLVEFMRVPLSVSLPLVWKVCRGLQGYF